MLESVRERLTAEGVHTLLVQFTDVHGTAKGKLVLNASMDQVGERYAEVMVGPDKFDAARALRPLSERQVFGKSIFLFDGVDQAQLAQLGELHKPSIADLFVAMKGTYA